VVTGVSIALVAALAWPRAERVRGHAYAVPSGEDRVVVEVLNASGRDGLARRVARQLRSRGLDVVNFGNESPSDSTRVLLRRGAPEAAEQVRGALGQGTVVVAPDTLRRVDVTVVLGADYLVQAELRP
jgi:calcineurin-like phosphoesterase